PSTTKSTKSTSPMEELAAHARENPVVLGHFGAGATPTEISMAAQEVFDFSWAGDAAFDALDCNTLASGDADVINTTLQLVLPCLDQITPLAAVTVERIALLPDTPTLGELAPELELATWNGLFVHRDVPMEARAKIEAAAIAALQTDRARQVAEQVGAQIYWLDADASRALMEKDGATIAAIAAMNE
ncbi:MAG: tripartite tricarboxylate transporter substrate binding protein, partial [Rhodobacteraceae bacterium]|nr:tripartite tricarboxylate transporter substrate binding protein [Paracoccaceae bacterium]